MICKIFSFLFGFILIPPKYDFDGKLFSYLMPNPNVSFWEVRHYDLDNFKENSCVFSTIYNSSKDSVLKFNFQYNKRQYFEPNYSSNIEVYIYKTKDGCIKNIHNLEELKFFLGEIDNLEEALFLAAYHGYWFVPDSFRGGSYKKNKNGYKLNLYKISSPPDLIIEGQKPVYKTIFVDKRGNISEL